MGAILRELLEVHTKIAVAQGYDSYPDYAYRELYDRDYTVKEIQNVYVG